MKQFDAKRDSIAAQFRVKHPDNYLDVVRPVIEAIQDIGIDPTRICEIDHGDYQGTLVYVIPEKGHQPGRYWSVKVFYGSCSGCDTLCAINIDYTDTPDKQQVADYMTLALHIIQGLKEI